MIVHMHTCIASRCCNQPHRGLHHAWFLLLQAPKPKRKYIRRKDPAEVSAVFKVVNSRLVDDGGEMVPRYLKAGRKSGGRLTSVDHA
jgi:hypothetical protein